MQIINFSILDAYVGFYPFPELFRNNIIINVIIVLTRDGSFIGE